MAQYDERRAALEALRLHGTAWRTTPVARGAREVEALYEFAREWRLEGVVAKRASSRYEPGRRSAAWVKLKWPWARDVVASKARLAAALAL